MSFFFTEIEMKLATKLIIGLTIGAGLTLGACAQRPALVAAPASPATPAASAAVAVAPAPKAVLKDWIAPEISKLPDDKYGQSVRHGKALMEETYKHIGQIGRASCRERV